MGHTSSADKRVHLWSEKSYNGGITTVDASPVIPWITHTSRSIIEEYNFLASLLDTKMKGKIMRSCLRIRYLQWKAYYQAFSFYWILCLYG